MVTPFRRILFGIRNLVAGLGRETFESQRDFVRADVDTEVTVFFEGRVHEARLLDVSISGAMLQPIDSMTVGAVLELELPKLPGRVEAKVMRLTHGGVGIRFLNPGIGVLIAGWSRGTSTAPVLTPVDTAGRR
jgi:hypothetical protein